MTSRSRESGVTLIEILIAVTLLSLLSIAVLVSMRIGFSTMDRVDTRLISNRRVSYARRIIENQIAGYTYTLAIWQPGTENARSTPFNQWDPQTMRFVTSYSLQDSWRGRPQIAAFQVIPGADGVGFRLIVNETPYTGSAQAGQAIAAIDLDGAVHFQPVVPGANSFVLADKLAYCRFSYLEPQVKPPLQLWRPDWAMKLTLPQGIRIDMAPLDPTPADLHVSTVTAALHVNLTPGVVYADTP